MRRYGEGGTELFQAVEVFALRARASVPAGIPVARPERAAPAEPQRPTSTGPGAAGPGPTCTAARLPGPSPAPP